MAGLARLIAALAVAALFTAAWIAAAWVVMVVSLYVARAIPLSGRRKGANRSRLT